jgi:hypothetical protein
VELFDARPDELGVHADLVERIFAGEALGCVVRGAVSEAAIARALARIDGCDAPKSELAPHALALGCMLAPTAARPSGPSFEEYLAAAFWRVLRRRGGAASLRHVWPACGAR